MASERRGSRIVPVSLGIAMLAVVVLAGLTPNTGVVRASSNCTYGQCPTPATFPTWAIATAIALVVVALLVALLILRRRRTPPPATPVSEWSGGGPPGSPPPGAAGPMPPGAPTEWEETAAAGAGVGAGVETDWREPTTPEPMAPQEPPSSVPEPPVAPEVSVPAPASPPGATEPEAEPDIDSLMAELDKISSEILKRTPKKRADLPSSGDAGEEPPP